MTSLPLWAVFTIGFGTPVMAFTGVVVAQLVGRRGAHELEIRSRREEDMRTLRWAAELATSADDRIANLGVAELTALLGSHTIDDPEKQYVEAALDAVYDYPEDDIDAIGSDTEAIERRPIDDPARPGGSVSGVRLTRDGDGGGEDA